VAGYYGRGNEPSGSINDGTFLDHLSMYQVSKDSIQLMYTQHNEKLEM
jgi:hypothetical protein